jgi:ankyrin repeat protein
MNQEKPVDDIFNELSTLIKLNKTNEFSSMIKMYYTEHKFNANYQNEYGNTLLHIACRARNYIISKLLIDTYDARVDIQNEDKRSALHFAIIYGSTDSSAYLFNSDSTKKNILNASKIITLIMDYSPCILLLKDKDNMTPKDYLDKIAGSNDSVTKCYNKYKHYIDFFNNVQKHSIDQEDYNLTVSIFASLRNNSKCLSRDYLS